MVTAVLNYTLDTGVRPVSESYGPNNSRFRYTGMHDPHAVEIADGRPRAREFSLDVHGFAFVEHPTAMRDFFAPGEIERVYYPEVEALVKQLSGAARVVVFDHTLRSGDAGEREARLVREPVTSVHNDYTERSAPRRVREILPNEAEALLARRFAIVQVWRAIDQPIRTHPLAIADARTVAPADLIPAERRYPHRVGEIYQARYNPAHRWFYFPEMRRDEALVFKTFDSATDGRARSGVHTAFDDPSTPPAAPPRRSIEARAFAFFD